MRTKEIETRNCKLKVLDTGYTFNFARIYCLQSCHKKTGKVLIRFGTKAQIQQMLNTYHLEKRFKL